jgi:hypothetical protein
MKYLILTIFLSIINVSNTFAVKSVECSCSNPSFNGWWKDSNQDQCCSTYPNSNCSNYPACNGPLYEFCSPTDTTWVQGPYGGSGSACFACTDCSNATYPAECESLCSAGAVPSTYTVALPVSTAGYPIDLCSTQYYQQDAYVFGKLTGKTSGSGNIRCDQCNANADHAGNCTTTCNNNYTNWSKAISKTCPPLVSKVTIEYFKFNKSLKICEIGDQKNLNFQYCANLFYNICQRHIRKQTTLTKSFSCDDYTGAKAGQTVNSTTTNTNTNTNTNVINVNETGVNTQKSAN